MVKLLNLSPLNRYFIGGSLDPKSWPGNQKTPLRTQAKEMLINFARVTLNLPKEKCLDLNIWEVEICSGSFCHYLQQSSLEAFPLFTCTTGGWRTIIYFRKLFCLSCFSAPQRCAQGVKTYSPNSLKGFMDQQAHLPSTVSDKHCFQTVVRTKQG